MDEKEHASPAPGIELLTASSLDLFK